MRGARPGVCDEPCIRDPEPWRICCRDGSGTFGSRLISLVPLLVTLHRPDNGSGWHTRLMKAHVMTLAAVICLAAIHPTVSAQKTPVTSAAELPRRSYQLHGSVRQILDDRAQLDRLSQELEKNLQTDLATFDIQDKATLVGYYSTLLTLALRKDDRPRVQELIARIRELETKPAAKLTSGLFAQVLTETRAAVPAASNDAFGRAFEENYLAALRKLPYAEIKEYVDTTRAQSQMMNRDLMLGGMESGLQPILEKTKGLVPEGTVAGLVATQFALEHRLPLNDEIGRALDRLVTDAAPPSATNIWKERDVSLDPEGLKPVVIAIWDSGVDMTSLPGQHRFTNSNEPIDGRDNDNNGFVDDRHGIAFDMSAMRRVTGTLDDRIGQVSLPVDRLHELFKGNFDMASGRKSPEADAFQKAYAALKPDQVKDFSDALSFFTVYAHGTHVAGIAAAGNPSAQILAVRMTTPFRQPIPAHTMEHARWTASMYRDVVAYLQQQKVRVVNMSWRYTAASIEASLTVNNVGKDAQERKALARRMFEVEKQALFEAIKSAPGILFVCGSGNEDNDADFSEYIPASFNLPNLVTIGAVDAAGRKTSFTTEGKSVDFYAGGHQIESYAPGSRRMLLSGTSMSSPQVANLAGKILALNPSLTPEQVIEKIRAGAEPSSEDPKILLINPKRTLESMR
jgi:hypothetical protein